MNLKTLIKDTVMDHILIFSDLVWAEQIFDSRISWVLSLYHTPAATPGGHMSNRRLLSQIITETVLK